MGGGKTRPSGIVVVWRWKPLQFSPLRVFEQLVAVPFAAVDVVETQGFACLPGGLVAVPRQLQCLCEAGPQRGVGGVTLDGGGIGGCREFGVFRLFRPPGPGQIEVTQPPPARGAMGFLADGQLLQTNRVLKTGGSCLGVHGPPSKCHFRQTCHGIRRERIQDGRSPVMQFRYLNPPRLHQFRVSQLRLDSSLPLRASR